MTTETTTDDSESESETMTEIEFEVGDRVYATDPYFEDGVVHEGVIVDMMDQLEVDVAFDHDPIAGGRESRVLTMAHEQVLPGDASAAEMAQFCDEFGAMMDRT